MNRPPLPPLPEPNLHAHELLSNDGGVWLGCKDKSVVERAHDPGETGEEVRALFTAEQMQAYAEQYGRLCAEAAAAELDRLQARVAELEVDAERLTDDGAEDIRALADRLLGRTASFPDMRQAALLLQDMYLEHRTASRKAKP